MAFAYSVTRAVITHVLQIDGTLSAGNGAATMEMDYPGEIIGAWFQIGVDGQTSSSEDIMIRVDKTTDTDALSAVLTLAFDAGNNAFVGPASLHATQANREFADGDSIVLDVDSISGTGGTNALVQIVCRGR